MDNQNQPHIRFTETPPGSPKSCMKGARKLTFDDKPSEGSVSGSGSGETSFDSQSQREGASKSPRSPRKSTKFCIRSPGENASPPGSPPKKVNVSVAPVPPIQKPPDIQFSQHYDQSTPPPNCTSNGNYDFVDPNEEICDPRNDPYLLDVASKFVNEIIETAALEAANRQKRDSQGEAKPNISAIARELLSTTGGRSGALFQRAKGTVSKWITNLCVKAQNSIRT